MAITITGESTALSEELTIRGKKVFNRKLDERGHLIVALNKNITVTSRVHVGGSQERTTLHFKKYFNR